MEPTVTAFLDGDIIASGERDLVTRLLEERYPNDHSAIVVLDNDSGRVTDLDYWDALKSALPRRSGRPKLGVQSREVTLLPRHWEWLAGQPGGASATLRRLVEEARRQGGGPRERTDAAYRAMQTLCGDRMGFEEAARALYKGDEARFEAIVASWPEDAARFISQLRAGGSAQVGTTAEHGPDNDPEAPS